MQFTLKSARQYANLKQSQIAEKLGVSETTVSFWENGRYDIPKEKFEQFCEIVGIKKRDILLP